MNQYLVIVRCGRSSLHSHWLSGDVERNWDLAVCPFQDIEHEPASVIPATTVAGQKWTGIYSLLAAWDGWRSYDYIWLPDDDLLTDAGSINSLFRWSRELKTQISAPALSADSFYSFPETMQNRSFFARAVTFIEVMMPCIRRDTLERFLPTISHTKSGYGWGLDFVWPLIINYQDMVIFDHISVKHTRPVGSIHDQSIVKLATDEMERLNEKHGLTELRFKTLGAYNSSGFFRYADLGGFLLDYLDGYRYLVERSPPDLKLLIDHQYAPMPGLLALPGDIRREAGNNLALNKPALVSSVSRWSKSQFPAEEARGGNNGFITGGCGFHTSRERNPWWQVDLEVRCHITLVAVFNRLDLRYRCTRMELSISDDGEVWLVAASKADDSHFGGADGKPFLFRLDTPATARFVRIRSIAEEFLHLDEVEVYGTVVTA